MTGQDLINNFEPYTGDTTELSTQAELDLANKIYRKILNDRDWEFLKKSATGTITVTNGLATITPPGDFSHFAINSQITDIAQGLSNNASPKVIFVSTTTGIYNPYQIIHFSDRRQFYNMAGYVYYDAVNNLITFTQAPTVSDLSYEFDYIYVPASLTLMTSPVFPVRFHDAIYHGMAVDDMIIQLFDRSHTYQEENQKAFDAFLSQLRFWNAQLQMQ